MSIRAFPGSRTILRKMTCTLFRSPVTSHLRSKVLKVKTSEFPMRNLYMTQTKSTASSLPILANPTTFER
ncbi:hypothetical protein D9M72_547920 [compost metagenome]